MWFCTHFLVGSKVLNNVSRPMPPATLCAPNCGSPSTWSENMYVTKLLRTKSLMACMGHQQPHCSRAGIQHAPSTCFAKGPNKQKWPHVLYQCACMDVCMLHSIHQDGLPNNAVDEGHTYCSALHALRRLQHLA